jgi:hypothetical protein
MIDCVGYGAGLYSPPSQTQAVTNHSQIFLDSQEWRLCKLSGHCPDQRGAKKFLERYGEQLVCVCHRYDEQRCKRFTTVEIIVEESGWSPPEKPEIVGLRVEFRETKLQRRVKQAGGKWNSTMRV